MTDQRTYSTHEACRMADVTYRQANHWCVLGVLGDELRPQGAGTRVRWASVDILALCAVAAYARIVHGWNDEPRGSAGVRIIGPAISAAVRSTPDAEWLVVTPDRQASAHRALPDAVRAVTLRGGLLVDLTAVAA